MPGNLWHEYRRLPFHILRAVGLGKKTIETLVKEEIDQFLITLDNCGESVGLKKDFSLCNK
uniref:Uncharacterized protein n=1 Tax=Tetranychus urticae TaxID=32264 RepID=T1KYA2_TETUR